MWGPGCLLVAMMCADEGFHLNDLLNVHCHMDVHMYDVALWNDMTILLPLLY